MGKTLIPIIGDIKINNYNLTNDVILRKAKEVINKFIEGFSRDKSPLLYMDEVDIQSQIASDLKEVIPPISIEIISEDNKSINIPELGLIRCEYPIGNKYRFDVACTNPHKIEEYVKWKSPIKINWVLWELPILFALEIKYSLFGYNTGYFDIKNDFDKLKSTYNDQYHKNRNRELDDLNKNFTKDFRFLALEFFQDKEWFTRHTERLIKKEFLTNFNQVDKVDEFDSIYLITFGEILKIKID